MIKKGTCILIVFLFFSGTLFAQNVIDSLDLKLGQMLLVGMPGKSVTPSSQIVQDVKKGLVGGILFFESNLASVNTKQTLSKLCNDLQDAAPIPLFISIDQEGGQVNRLKTKYGFPAMPSAKAVNDANNDEYATTVANTIAQTVSNVGINLNFAPVVDVHNPLCPVLGKHQRCYSNNVEEIAHQATILIEAHKARGVKTALKHFPGHGNSLTDSHLGMADVSKYWSKRELVPYKMLMDEGIVDMVMIAHVVNKQLDPSGLPATLSKTIIQDVLRKGLNYQGVVITDDMQMQAISKYYGLEESLKKSILAGADILIFSNNIKGAAQYNPQNIHATLKKLVQRGAIPMKRINESYERILALKQSR